MRYRLQRHDGTDCSATMVPITVLRMVPIQRYRQYGQPPIDTPEETSAIPFKKMKPKNEAYNIPRIEKSDCTIK